jgi:hypothetical protein
MLKRYWSLQQKIKRYKVTKVFDALRAKIFEAKSYISEK